VRGNKGDGMESGSVKQVIVYREPGRYAGWPANYGIWAWSNEIVAGFTLGYVNPAGGFHARDVTRPFMPMQARSPNGGETWQVQPTPCRTPGNRGMSADEHVQPGLRVGAATAEVNAPVPHPGGLDFTGPDFALMCARSGLGAGTTAWFYTSLDRCRSWQGPYSLPMFGQPGVEARTDYLVLGPSECLLFLTATKSNGKEGRVFCAHVTGGGKEIAFRSWIGPEPDGFAIMPASVRLPGGRILVAQRCKEGGTGFADVRHWIDLYSSDDLGLSWQYLTRPVPDTGSGGNPPTLTLLDDGRLCLIYGYRKPPFGMRARLSSDGGQTWSEPVVLRDGAGNHDLGYPRTILRPDGVIVTVYYFNDDPGGDRYIEATLWKP
jgi:hypothetical protein